ncbi:MAG: glycoside hydrolase family 127 protein [Bacteroidales bacterium]|nr:glycoside hydrolase family 127 protein [Bacteroidales bacterium]
MRSIRHIAVSLLIMLPVGLLAQPWEECSLRDIEPGGWLLEKLQTQRTGLTGHPEALSYPYNTCLWAGEIPRMGDHGRDWWRYEQTAYYTDGLLRLGYLLDDRQLIEKGEAGIGYTLEHPWENGRLGSPLVDYTWPFAVFFRAMKAAYDVSPDPAILQALTRHYNSIPLAQLVRKRDIISLEGMLWTAGKTGDKSLTARADSAFRMRRELLGDRKLSRDDRVTPEFLRSPEPYKMHGVTMSEILKLPIMLYAATGDPWYKDLAVYSLDRLYEEDGLPDGLFTSAEWLQGREIRHSHETCNAVDMTWTLGYFLEILKAPRYADMLEKIVFNAGAGSVTADFKALQYYSSVNQFIATGTSNHNKDNYCSTWMAYRPTHQTECCAGNIHRLYPDYAARMWLRGKKEAVAALYGPSRFRYSDALSFTEQTEYPYGQTVTITAEAAGRKQRARLTLRIPGWCTGASLTLNGKPVRKPLAAGTFVTLNRRWASGDKVVLTLPMKAERNEAYGGGAWFERGPLVYSYAIPADFRKDTVRYANMNGKYPADDEAFPCWDIRPSGAWNYAVPADAQPEDDGAHLRIPVVPIEWDWDKGPHGELLTPDIPKNITPTGPEQYLELVPYGQTTLRLTVFPVLEGRNQP